MTLSTLSTPDLGGATDVTVIEVLVKPGDRIEKEQGIVTLESDKATMDIPTEMAGTVKEVKVKVGDKVEMGQALITLDAVGAEEAPAEMVQEEKKEAKKEKKPIKEEKVAKEEDKKKGAKKALKEEEVKEETKEESRVLTGTLQTDNDVHAGPGVRRLAREFGVNLTLVTGTGPKSRIIKEDVQKYVKTELSQAKGGLVPGVAMLPAIDFTKFGPVDYQPLSRIKKLSGKNLQRNWMMIPHVTQFGEADITELEDFRNAQKESLQKQGVKFTPLVFIMKAVVGALKTYPTFNASLEPNGETLVVKKYYHLGVAVDTPEGLLVPVIRDVDKKGLVDLAKELAVVSEKARKKQLLPNEMQGGTFSISSLGGIGGTAFTPIINYPEVAILGVSKSSYKPVYQDGHFVPRLMLPLSLSYDHRVVDGAEGARFIQYLGNMLSDIRNLLL